MELFRKRDFEPGVSLTAAWYGSNGLHPIPSILNVYSVLRFATNIFRICTILRICEYICTIRWKYCKYICKYSTSTLLENTEVGMNEWMMLKAADGKSLATVPCQLVFIVYLLVLYCWGWIVVSINCSGFARNTPGGNLAEIVKQMKSRPVSCLIKVNSAQCWIFYSLNN